jgi:hypothetical protein
MPNTARVAVTNLRWSNENKTTEQEEPMRRLSYYKRASRRFLQGTRHRTPAEAVEAGTRSLEQWVTLLSEERELEGEYVQERKMRQHQRRVDHAQSAVTIHQMA